MNRQLKLFFVTAILLLIVNIGFAQPAAGGPPGGPSGGGLPPCWPPPCVPVDGGISILIAFGAAYGSKKAFDHFNSDENIVK